MNFNISTFKDFSSQEEWLNSLIADVGGLLRKVVPNEYSKITEGLFSSDNIHLLISAFTHKTYNPEIGTNLERLEYLGDAAMKSAFKEYAFIRFPGINETAFTEFDNVYLSNIYQADLLDNLNFTKYVRFSGYDRVIMTLKADAFESFCGFLMRAGNSLHGENTTLGLGHRLVFMLMKYIFDSVEFDMKRAAGNPKTLYVQLFSKHNTETIHTEDAGIYITKVKFTSANATTIGYNTKFGRDLNAYIKENYRDGIIGIGESYSKKRSETAAFYNAMMILDKGGLTNQKYDSLKRDRKLGGVPRDLQSSVNMKVKEAGYVTFDLNKITPKEDDDSGLIAWQLVGIKKDGSHDNLLTKTYSKTEDINDKRNFIDLMKSYLKAPSRLEVQTTRAREVFVTTYTPEIESQSSIPRPSPRLLTSTSEIEYVPPAPLPQTITSGALVSLGEPSELSKKPPIIPPEQLSSSLLTSPRGPSTRVGPPQLPVTSPRPGPPIFTRPGTSIGTSSIPGPLTSTRPGSLQVGPPSPTNIGPSQIPITPGAMLKSTGGQSISASSLGRLPPSSSKSGLSALTSTEFNI